MSRAFETKKRAPRAWPRRPRARNMCPRGRRCVMERSLVRRDVWRMSWPLFALAALLAGFMLFLGVRGLWLPLQAAHGFGLPLHDGDASWLRIKAARDLSIGLAIAVLMGLRMRSALGVFLLAGGIIPLLDCVISC